MRLQEILIEALNGTFVHETNPTNAEQIAKNGFKPRHTGIFFNRYQDGYSGGGYGKAHVIAKLNISKLLDVSDDADFPDDLDELADGEEVATYARKHGYQAWADDLQIAVLDPSVIQVVSIR